ncbi:MAG: aldo/keto reductase, partial [Rhizobiales bacterium]|nr:aldo/keto reductase [Hyphomicrobiales bacterium]
KEEIGVITYFGLAKGFLTGKYREKSDLAQSQRGEDVADYMNPRGMQILEALDQVAKRHNARSAEVALAWVMAQPGVTAPIASATSVEQVRSLVRAASLNLEVADLALLSGTGPRQL